jgi:hypothetical protein
LYVVVSREKHFLLLPQTCWTLVVRE